MRLSRAYKVDLLRAIPLFGGCSRAQLDVIARMADEVSFPKGRVLIRQGAPGGELIVVVEGEIEIERDGKQIARKGDGDFVGELSLVTGRPRTATVTAASDVRILVLASRHFKQLLRDVPPIAVKVLDAVAERLPPEDE